MKYTFSIILLSLATLMMSCSSTKNTSRNNAPDDVYATGHERTNNPDYENGQNTNDENANQDGSQEQAPETTYVQGQQPMDGTEMQEAPVKVVIIYLPAPDGQQAPEHYPAPQGPAYRVGWRGNVIVPNYQQYDYSNDIRPDEQYYYDQQRY
jgi:hypothetical protein